MNPIQELQGFLLATFPDVRATLDEPLAENGVWSMDVFRPGYHLGIAWQAGKGFGLVSDDEHGYGEGAHEVFEDLDQALPRVVNLIACRMPTTTPPQVRLKDIREKLGK